MSRTVLVEGSRSGLAVAACAVLFAVLGLSPSLSWIPELPLLGSALLVPVAIYGVTGFRTGLRRRRVLDGALAGALAGAISGAAAGLCFVLYGKSPLNVLVGIVLGAAGGGFAGSLGALLALRRSDLIP
jgi:hypothetical protein